MFVWVELWCSFWLRGVGVWCWVVDARHHQAFDPVSGLLVLVCMVGVGQALGLLVPVGWALLLYTSGLSTP